MPKPGIFGFDFSRFGRKKGAEAAGRREPAVPYVGMDVPVPAGTAPPPDPAPELAALEKANGELADAVGTLRASGDFHGFYVPASVSGDGSGFPLAALSAQRQQDNMALFGSPDGEPRYESMEHYHAAGAPNGAGGTLHINADGHLRGLPEGHPMLAGERPAETPEEAEAARHAEAMRLAREDRMRLAREDLQRQAKARAAAASGMTGGENADAAAGLHGGDA